MQQKDQYTEVQKMTTETCRSWWSWKEQLQCAFGCKNRHFPTSSPSAVVCWCPNSDFALRKTFGDIWNHFWWSQLRQGELLPALSGYKPGALLSVLKCSLWQRNIWPSMAIVVRLKNPLLKESFTITWPFRDTITLRVYKWDVVI